MATVSVSPATETLRRCIEEGRFDALRGALTRDAVLDANVPQWHFLRQGVDDVVAQFEAWFPDAPIEVTWVEQGTGRLAVVELTDRKIEDGSEVYSRTALIVELEDDRIARLAFYCFGVQDRETEERNRREAPLY